MPDHQAAKVASASHLSIAQRGWRALHDLRERIAPARPIGRAWKPAVSGEDAGHLIYTTLERPAPALIARFGAGELEAVLRHLAIGGGVRLASHLRYLLGAAPAPWWDAAFLSAMELHTGLFPATPQMLARFADRMLADVPSVDILGSWLPGERTLVSLGLKAKRVPLVDLEPYYHTAPWSRVLRGRTVLVVHPLADLIRAQFAKRERLFPDREVLPQFTLRTVTAIVSNAGARPKHADWFEALDAMTQSIAGQSFDVAIIGAGAYGLPLAAAVKRMGRQAVHLGGATQILFGIRGRRWDEMPFFQRLFNAAWVHPDLTNRPPRWHDVEGGCYW